jgi:hypothetical protein
LVFERLVAARTDCCPPGIGFVGDSGHILHICPNREGAALVHYQFTEPYRIFGLFATTRAVVRSNMAVSSSEIGEFIRRFYAADHEWLCERTAV